MMVTTRPRRTREVTGPTPHSVAIYARSANKRPPEQLILDRRRQEEQRQQAEDITKYNKFCDLKNDWERTTDKRIQLNTVRRRVQTLMQAHSFTIEDRREKLRNLLAEEEQAYLEEMEGKQETVLERQAKMRERAKALREKRERERLGFVQDKLEQQWREQCEELRSTMSKRQQDLVAAERMKQLHIKEDMEAAQRADEQMFADLWRADMEAKAKREEEETKRQMSANHDMLQVLNTQMAALEAQKQEELRLKEEEAQLLKQQAELRALEEQQAAAEKARRQSETRNMYDRSIKMKQEKAAREMQEQLAFDLAILEKLLEDSHNEAVESAQRKKELREEYQRYRAYLAEIKAEEALREREVDRMCDAEVEKMWQKKTAQWRLEKEARRRLLEEVLAGRKQQVAEKLERNRREMAETAREKEELNRRIEENKVLEKEHQRRVAARNLSHQSDLFSQMQYNRELQLAEDDEEHRLWLAQRDAELEYRTKLELALESDFVDNLHPIRKAMNSRRAISAGQLNC